MGTVPSKHRIYFLLIAVTITEITLVLVRDQIYKFIKLEEMRFPYLVLFPVLLFLSLFLIIDHLENSVILAVMLGLISGQLSSTFALTFANFFIKNGIQRNLESFGRDGFLTALMSDAGFAFIIGGWLFGVGAVLVYFVIYRTILRRASKPMF